MLSQTKIAVINVVKSIQEASGQPSGGINGSTRPLSDLNGFDSLNCVEASTELSISLGFDIEADIGLFTENGENRTIDEIVEIIENYRPKAG